MDNLKHYGRAIGSIVEKLLLISIGAGIVIAAIVEVDVEQLRLAAIAFGAASFAAGLLPMFVAFAKANWPKRPKKSSGAKQTDA